MDLSVLRIKNPFFSYLVVEGKTDCLIYSKFINNDVCRITSAYGKENVIETIKKIEKRQVRGILGIIDADFWRIQGKQTNSNIIMTDGHDVETLILFKTDILENILIEYGNSEKIQQFETISNKKIIELIVCSALPMGILRFISEIENFELNFKHIRTEDFKNFLDLKNLSLICDRYVSFMLKRSENFEMIKENAKRISGETLDKNTVQNLIQEYLRKNLASFQICRGHDLCEILFIGLTEIFGRDGPDLPINRKSLESILRVAYLLKDFMKTQLWSSIRQWEDMNKDFKILNEVLPKK